MRDIYLDNAATTKVHSSVIGRMLPYFSEFYGNPSSIYKLGRDSRDIINNTRERMKKVLNITNGEIYFTGSGTEADNWALVGVADAYKNKGNHIITTKIELNTA